MENQPSETIGSLISRLFPEGFRREEYFCLLEGGKENEQNKEKALNFLKSTMRGEENLEDFIKSLSLQKHHKVFRENEEKLKKKIDKLYKKKKDRIKKDREDSVEDDAEE